MKITDIKAFEIVDSRGKPTVRAAVTLEDGSVHVSSVPSGASTGSHEAVELRDDDKSRYLGMGVLNAVNNVNTIIRDALIGQSVTDPKALDRKMLELDGTHNKSKLGANAILAVSQAVVRGAAYVAKKPLWQYINEYYMGGVRPAFPRLMVNVVNGGKHANWNFDIQEFMVIPTETTPSTSVRVAAEIFAQMGKNFKKKGLSILVGDEGGYSPALNSNSEVLSEIQTAAQTLGYENGQQFHLALDCAATEFYDDSHYVLKKENKKLTGQELADMYTQLQAEHQILSFEDPFSEDDWDTFTHFTTTANEKGFVVVGDDLFVTNKDRLQMGIDKGAGNAILVKVNQIGSILETIETIQLARKHNYKVIISHRSGETEDAFIADLAYAVGADMIKTGSMSRSERLAKYNRLLEIENNI